MQQGTATSFRSVVDLAGTQAGTGLVEQVLRLNLG